MNEWARVVVSVVLLVCITVLAVAKVIDGNAALYVLVAASAAVTGSTATLVAIARVLAKSAPTIDEFGRVDVLDPMPKDTQP
jgi:hypothetical protein